MHRIIVIGSVNHDRIWQLEDRLVPGGRLRFSGRDVHLGGGAFYTGCQLVDLGAEVALVTRLMQDEQGLSALNALDAAGFDTQHVTMLPGETMPLEILLEPNGERTILAPAGRDRTAFSAGDALTGDAAYINALLLDETLVGRLCDIALVVSQLPLRQATPRPADYVVTSRNDAGEEPQLAWRRAVNLAGPRLKMLVLTDGPRPITLYGGSRSILIDPAPAVQGVSTIGAGDRFSGAFLFALLNGRDAASAAAEASRLTADWLRRRHR
ncbi:MULTISPECIES: PfkB family carbohydrate kinase [unclassified Sinorhizobium]|uniref:PfkB family carbohydrate kinase n=1 Tax=unclassified Sinorhizobium TaxID=2613772 RepID=UPI003524D7F5